MVKQVANAGELDSAINSGNLVVVDFFATWCGPCKRIAPSLDELSKQESSVTFLKVDVDELEDVAAKYEVSAMPTFLFFKSGSKVAEVVGANIEAVKKKVAEHK